jgi:uncharacterized protein (DUF58 family)
LERRANLIRADTLTFAARGREPVEAALAAVALDALDTRPTHALARVDVAVLVRTPVAVACALLASLLRVDVPVAVLAAIARSADDMRTTLALTSFGVTNPILGAADMTITT